MKYGSLENYISAQRRATGISQDELAILIGLEGRSSISRYELGLRLPELQTLIALEVVFDLPLQELFAGIAERVREEIPSRARVLLEGMGEKPTAQNVEKISTLARLAGFGDDNLDLWRDVA